ncbi:hypothetical protein EXIGLDRAFT_828191 [Exidia glandulosa HHB12029]|uniref:Uncharacterized protein n=1 Tax=Exidia glandulosa HHB12029 TaxID=1314781 RepID=A0A165QZI3_EXIGL|nr:hypothetical protein EXIGLDRAFT_828191 [Exidia glandulosa HHB12029]
MSALDPSALLSLLPSLLPQDGKKLSSPTDALAVLFHTMLTALEFRLVAIDDDSVHQHAESNVLPPQWTAHPGTHTFRYKHTQSSLEFVLKIIRLASRTVVNAITTETDKVAVLDIQTKDFTSQAFFPYDFLNANPLVHGYISSARVSDLASSFKTQIVQKILPGLRKDGYQDSSETAGQAVIPPSTSGPSRERPAPAQPRQPAPQQPFDPGHPFGEPVYPRGGNPLEIGRRDREPIITDPFAPPHLGPPMGGGGMFVGPDDPILGGGGWGGPARPARGGGGPWGGDGFLPPMGAPPGARFDPVGPFGPGQGQGGPRLPRRDGNPDNDEFMPPGFGSDMII